MPDDEISLPVCGPGTSSPGFPHSGQAQAVAGTSIPQSGHRIAAIVARSPVVTGPARWRAGSPAP